MTGSAVVALAIACGSSDDSAFTNGTDDNASGGTSGQSSGSFNNGSTDGSANQNPAAQPIDLTPKDQVVTFVSGSGAPSITYVAKTVNGGTVVPATFSIDRGEIGTVNLTTGVFTASGNAGGKATITATWNGTTATTTVTVNLKVIQNGGPANVDAGNGSGGFGGVGGDGFGSAALPAQITALGTTPQNDTNLSMLYPYDSTVWPRGILSPLLQWQPGAHGPYDAIKISFSETNYSYDGTFAANAPTFQNHPIPQDVWKQLLTSNSGEDVTVTLVLSKGTTAYGPLTTKWRIASAPLKGVVYYQSYGTRLAKNFEGAKGPGDGLFGGATLAIRGSSTDPALVAGKSSVLDAGVPNHDDCRVCHSVAANGSALITQQNVVEDRLFSTYNLKQTPAQETVLDPRGTSDANYGWSAVYPDGTMFLNSSDDGKSSSNTDNQLYSMPVSGTESTPAKITTTGWPAGLRGAYPAFSPDGKNVAFTKFAGSDADGKSLAYMPYDNAMKKFGAIKTIDTPAFPAVYPAFLPTNDGLVYQVYTDNNYRNFGETRAKDDKGAGLDTGPHAQLWWAHIDASGTATKHALDKLNGVGYLPQGPSGSGHDNHADEMLDYEPTVNPVPSGGYAWVVFTSRRMYGNVATINPYHSNPRNVDITSTPTTKKLWVAAIDLNAPAGTDPSHPAFYLPAQELLAGNARGYWVVDPCEADGMTCDSGDECCGGYCRPNAQGALVCSNVVPACAQEFEKCTQSSDCCNSPQLTCINARCAAPGTGVK